MKSGSAHSLSDDFIAPAKRAFLSVARQLRLKSGAAAPGLKPQRAKKSPQKTAHAS